MRNGKRTLFPSGGEELDLCQLRVGRTSPLYTPNHLSFKGMFMFAHFSPPIVLLEETQPITRMLRSFFVRCSARGAWSSLWPDLLKVQDSDGYLTTWTQLCGGRSGEEKTLFPMP